MNEQLIRSIIRLYALLAGSDGLLQEEKKRIEQFLSHHLSGRSVAIFLDLLDKTNAKFEGKRNDNVWLEKEIESIAKVVNKELKLAQKFYLYLELVELSALDGDVSISENQILRKIEQVLNFNQNDVQQLLQFGLAQRAQQLDLENCLLVSAHFVLKPEKAFQLEVPGLRGEIAVLKLPSSEAYFMRHFGETDSYLNGQIIPNGMSCVWASGATFRQEEIDPIFFADIREKFSSPIDRPPIHFEAKDLEFQFANGKMGLHQINLSEKGGRMIAIMGASGCGKSTLFNVLNGNEKPSKGKVLINGKSVHENLEELEGVIGYIPQDDVLNEHLTVFQNLYFSAKFSFGKWSEDKIKIEVDKTLHSLGITEARDTEVGSVSRKKISGGQRKRLNIGMELIRQPSVLFVDEPTSGLSSRDSVKTMELLKDLAINGKLVFVIIHQPSAEIFKMFDHLIVLDKGGYPIYYGNSLEAVPYFRTAANLPAISDPSEAAEAAEIFDIIELKIVNEMGEELEERKRLPHEWYELFKKKPKAPSEAKVKSPIPKHIDQPGFFSQILIYLKRDFLSKLRDSQYLIINLFEAPFLALLLAILVRYCPSNGFTDDPYLFCHNENIPAYFFMSVIVALFMGLSVSAEEIIRDRLMLKREKFLHLSRSSYLIAKVFLLFSLSALHTLAFVAISDTVLEVNDIGFEFWMVLFSTSCCANMLGLVLSDTLKKAVAVYILIPLLLIPQLVLGGVVIQFDKLNPLFGNQAKVPVVGELMVSRWAYEALMVAQFKNNEYQKIIFESERKLEEYKYKRDYYLSELERILNELYFTPKEKFKIEEIKIKQGLLIKELTKEGLDFKVSPETWKDLQTLPYSEAVQEGVSKKIKAFKHFYTLGIQKEENKTNAIKSSYSKLPSYAKTMGDLRQISENEQVSQIVTNNNMMQKKAETTKDGIIRKATPIYQLPDPEHLFDLRAQLFAPMKHFMGKYFPTETFNIFIIWMFTLFTAIVLRFRLLRLVLKSGKN
jgi:ABC-type multidrug transport system ATPase subunit